MESLTYKQLLTGNRNFRNLLWGQVISELGNWFNFIAGLGLVRVISDASPGAAGIIFACRVIPFAFFSPIAGTFVDRFSRRKVMIATDLMRTAVALVFLFVSTEDDLWIAYTATSFLAIFGAFFDGAKNAATPNLTGKEGLLAGTALIFSSRFLLMAVGAALGGWASAIFGYKVAFIINAASFVISAISVWLIPEDAVKEKEGSEPVERASFFTELKEGFRYTTVNHFALTILIMNVIWATGGGAINIVFERMGGIVFAGSEGWNPDAAVSILWTAAGFGLFLGMMIAHRTSIYLDRRNNHRAFIGWMLIIHGVVFAAAGYVNAMWVFAILMFVSRLLIGVEYAVQETMFQHSLPDYIRGRISTLDRGAEMLVFGISSWLSGVAMAWMSPETLTILSGLLAGSAGVVWFIREGISGGARDKPSSNSG